MCAVRSLLMILCALLLLVGGVACSGKSTHGVSDAATLPDAATSFDAATRPDASGSGTVTIQIGLP